MSDKFCLSWNNFQSNISDALKDIREDKEFFDVTLVTEEHQIEAHKVVLSACSPFFRKILSKNAHPHPLLYLKGVTHKDLEGILKFMYEGRVNVAQVELPNFLEVAEELKVKGLTQSRENSLSKQINKPPAKLREPPDITANADNQPLNNSQPETADTEEIRENGETEHTEEDAMIKVETDEDENFNYDEYFTEPDADHQSEQRQQDQKAKVVSPCKLYTHEEIGPQLEPIVTIHHHPEEEAGMMAHQAKQLFPFDLINSFADNTQDWNAVVANQMFKRENTWHCVACEYTARNKTSVISHVQGKHLEEFPGYMCKICGSRSGTYGGFDKHMSRQHKFSLATRKNTM